jgi:predicted  nucleic acid-binding Zn-ribbon protein
MLPEIEQLLVLQDRDRKIRALRQELRNAPLERKALEEKLATSTKKLEAAKQNGREIEMARKQLENDARSRRDSIAKFQTQKFQTRKNEEFQALTNEINRYESEIKVLEDRELELMESGEVTRKTIAETEKEAQAVKALVERQQTELTNKIATVEAQLHTLEAERATFAGSVDEELLDTFDRLFANKTEAVVPLEHEICMGCHMKVTTQIAVKVKGAREVVHCEQCGRMLYAES